MVLFASPYRRRVEDSLQGSSGTHPHARYLRLIPVFVALFFRARSPRTGVFTEEEAGRRRELGEKVEVER